MGDGVSGEDARGEAVGARQADAQGADVRIREGRGRQDVGCDVRGGGGGEGEEA